MCHAIARHAGAGAASGPTSRMSAAARRSPPGTLPNTRGDLAGWIADPQAIKPGTDMPPVAARRRTCNALVAYLESLK